MEEKNINRKKFLESLEEAIPYLYKILMTYEKIDEESNFDTTSGYPFGLSFDEFFAEYRHWADKLNELWFPKTFEFDPTVTVGELKKILEKYEDDRQVVIWTEDKMWYQNINIIEFPDDYQTYTITLHIGSEFDTRQIGK